MIAPTEGWPWPPGTSWAWRADLAVGGAYLWPGRWVKPAAEVAPALKVFHEGAPPAAALAPGACGLVIWGEERAGAFLSLAIALPEDGVAGLAARRRLTLAARARLTAERALSARLALRHGLNTTEQTRDARLSDGLLLAEFDLAPVGASAAPFASASVELIVERPNGAGLVLTDLTLSHRPRAEP